MVARSSDETGTLNSRWTTGVTLSATVRIAVIHAPRENDYLESIRAAGAEPVLVHWATALVPQALDGVSGVLLTGGADVDPVLYGEPAHATYEPAGPHRDGFEIEAIRLALERDLPLLAICRGAQVLNVACGGTLWQDIPSQVGDGVTHQVSSPRDARAHRVHVVDESRLAALVADSPLRRSDGTLDVNSRHHQAIKHVAPGFVTTSTSADGVIESVERPASAFCVGVQWHPENFWRTAEFSGLFSGFVRACTQ